jgi:hypothetical protein
VREQHPSTKSDTRSASNRYPLRLRSTLPLYLQTDLWGHSRGQRKALHDRMPPHLVVAEDAETELLLHDFRHYAAPGGGAMNTSCLRATSKILGISVALPTSRSMALKKVDAPAREFTLRKRVPGAFI